MKTIGLCGGSGSGKGSVSDIFKLFEIPSIDTDRVYRDMTEYMSPCLVALREAFGEEIITPQETLDRQALRNAVFNSSDSDSKRKRLNEITHKFILDETEAILRNYRNSGYKAAIVDAPLLFESGFHKKCDIIISVIAEKNLRILRIIKRDGINREAAEARINSQLSDRELINRSDYTIINNGDITELEDQVRMIAEQILK